MMCSLLKNDDPIQEQLDSIIEDLIILDPTDPAFYPDEIKLQFLDICEGLIERLYEITTDLTLSTIPDSTRTRFHIWLKQITEILRWVGPIQNEDVSGLQSAIVAHMPDDSQLRPPSSLSDNITRIKEQIAIIRNQTT